MSTEENKSVAIQLEQGKPLTELPDYILTEVFLENIGYFTPSSKRIKGEKEKIVELGERQTADGLKKPVVIAIRPLAALGLPVTSDLDYYRAFLKICDEVVDNTGRFEIPIKVSSRRLADLAGKGWDRKTRKEIADWFDRMQGTQIKGGVYRANSKEYDDSITTSLFKEIVHRGEKKGDGKPAETNYVWPAGWWLSNYFHRYVKPVDFSFHRRLRKPIAKSLYPLLETGWYAAGGRAYSKRYRDLRAEFLLGNCRYLADLKKQLDPAHKELQQERFLKHWAYREAGEGGDFVITYYPGEKFFEDQKARESRRQLARRIDASTKATLEPKPGRENKLHLVQEILRVTGDKHSTRYYTKVVRELPEETIWVLISETKQASLEGRIRESVAQFFTDLAERALAKVREAKNQLDAFSS